MFEFGEEADQSGDIAFCGDFDTNGTARWLPNELDPKAVFGISTDVFQTRPNAADCGIVAGAAYVRTNGHTSWFAVSHADAVSARLAAPRRFAYYARLSPSDKAIYRNSDAIAEVPLPDVASLTPLVRAIDVALFSGKRVRVAKAVTAFIEAFLAQLGAPPVKVQVREVRPDLDDAELHGLYTFAAEDTPARLEVWMRTRAQEKVVKFRTFLRTIIHELLHHLDVTIFALDDSFHTEGFFRRESSIVRALLNEPKRAPRLTRAPKSAAPQLSLFAPAKPSTRE